MTDPTNNPAPVPPDKLTDDWYSDALDQRPCGEFVYRFMANKGAAWGYAQAMQDAADEAEGKS